MAKPFRFVLVSRFRVSLCLRASVVKKHLGRLNTDDQRVTARQGLEGNDFGYLVGRNGCCDDAEDSFWRYSAVNLKTIFAALACALLVFSMLGCGASNTMQSIQLNVKYVNGQAPSGQSGFFTLQGNGGTIQLQALAEFSSKKTKDITNEVTYTVIVDPNNDMDAFGNVLLPPCTAPCQTAGQGTVQYSNTGLITAVQPATCTWVDIAPLDKDGNPQAPAWFYSGDYKVTVSFSGMTSQPVYIPVASSAGNQFYAGQENNPTGLCGPSS